MLASVPFLVPTFPDGYVGMTLDKVVGAKMESREGL